MMKCAPLQDAMWSAFNNMIDIMEIREYERICREFNVDKNTPWCVDDDVSLGLGRGYSITGLLDMGVYDPNKMTYRQKDDGVIDGRFHNLCRNGSLKINITKFQQDFPDYYWNQFILF